MAAKDELAVASGVGDYFSSPALAHLTAYNTPLVSTKVAPKSTALPAKTPVATAKPQPVISPVAVSVSGTGLEASLGLNQSASLTGTPNAPATPRGANDPGLVDTPATTTTGVSMNWLWIALIVAIIIGLIWYYNPGNVLAR